MRGFPIQTREEQEAGFESYKERMCAKLGLCPVCEGKGSYEMPRDLHRSGGIVPCRHCNGTGKAP